MLSEEAIDISVRTIERVLAEEGFKKLPRRTQLKSVAPSKGLKSLNEPSRLFFHNLTG